MRTSRVSSPDIFIACDNCLDIGRALGRVAVGVAELGVVGLLLYTSPSLNCLLEYWVVVGRDSLLMRKSPSSSSAFFVDMSMASGANRAFA